MYNQLPIKRYNHTIDFLKKVTSESSKILDLGVKNPFTKIMKDNGYKVFNTNGEDLDLHPEVVNNYDVDIVTAFEIFEHLLAPFNVLREIKSKKLVATIPLNLWFAKAYRSKTDMWDRHYHEFEDWQFDWLLEKAGWQIKYSERWTSPINKLGFRPILRKYTPRYYAVYAERHDQ